MISFAGSDRSAERRAGTDCGSGFACTFGPEFTADLTVKWWPGRIARVPG
jgi:hypothetical protein